MVCCLIAHSKNKGFLFYLTFAYWDVLFKLWLATNSALEDWFCLLLKKGVCLLIFSYALRDGVEKGTCFHEFFLLENNYTWWLFQEVFYFISDGVFLDSRAKDYIFGLDKLILLMGCLMKINLTNLAWGYF